MPFVQFTSVTDILKAWEPQGEAGENTSKIIFLRLAVFTTSQGRRPTRIESRSYEKFSRGAAKLHSKTVADIYAKGFLQIVPERVTFCTRCNICHKSSTFFKKWT